MRQVPAWNTVRAPRTVEPWSWCAWLALVIWLLVRAFNQFDGCGLWRDFPPACLPLTRGKVPGPLADFVMKSRGAFGGVRGQLIF
jgi:hypothetical protein